MDDSGNRCGGSAGFQLFQGEYQSSDTASFCERRGYPGGSDSEIGENGEAAAVN